MAAGDAGTVQPPARSSPRRQWKSAPNDLPALWPQQSLDDDRESDMWGGEADSDGRGGRTTAGARGGGVAAVMHPPSFTPDPPYAYGEGGAEDELTPVQRARMRKAAQRQRENEARERELERARHEVFVDKCVLHGIEPPPGSSPDSGTHMSERVNRPPPSYSAPPPETYHDRDGDGDVDGYLPQRSRSAPRTSGELARTTHNPSVSNLSPAERARLRKEERQRAEREAHLKQLEAARMQAYRERCELESRHRPDAGSGLNPSPHGSEHDIVNDPAEVLGDPMPARPSRPQTTPSPQQHYLPPLGHQDDNDADDGLTPAERVMRRKERRQREEQERQAQALAEAHRQAHIDRVRLASKVARSPPQAQVQDIQDWVESSASSALHGTAPALSDVDDGLGATRVLPRCEVVALGQEADALAAEVSKFKATSAARANAISPHLMNSR